jgi:DNA-binding transcriptional regulator YiaG
MARPSTRYAGDASLVKTGQAIRALRAEVGMSQEALAYEAGG